MKKIVMTFLVAVVCLSGSFSSLSVKADEPVYETRAMVQEDSRLGPGAVWGAMAMGNGVHCWQVGRRNLAQCGVDAGQVISHTGRVIVNGWLDDGPHHPRPGVGVIWP